MDPVGPLAVSHPCELPVPLASPSWRTLSKSWTDYSAILPRTKHNSKVNCRTLVIVVAAPVMLIGCGRSAPDSGRAPVPPLQFTAKVEVPPSLAPTDLALISGKERLQVGDSLEKAARVLPSPVGAFGLKDLPPGFGQAFRARGFETRDDGLGLILVDNRVALAMRRVENVSVEAIEEVVKTYIRQFGEPDESISGARIEYRFWRKEDQRLMLCTAPDRAEPARFDVTVAVGVISLMDALRMSYPAAREDRAMAERALPGLRHPG